MGPHGLQPKHMPMYDACSLPTGVAATCQREHSAALPAPARRAHAHLRAGALSGGRHLQVRLLARPAAHTQLPLPHQVRAAGTRRGEAGRGGAGRVALLYQLLGARHERALRVAGPDPPHRHRPTLAHKRTRIRAHLNTRTCTTHTCTHTHMHTHTHTHVHNTHMHTHTHTHTHTRTCKIQAVRQRHAVPHPRAPGQAPLGQQAAGRVRSLQVRGCCAGARSHMHMRCWGGNRALARLCAGGCVRSLLRLAPCVLRLAMRMGAGWACWRLPVMSGAVGLSLIHISQGIVR